MKYLTNLILNQRIFTVIILVAISLRFVSAFFNYTPMAIDDYETIVEPAVKKLLLNQDYKLENYRVTFLPTIAKTIMQIPYGLGITSVNFLIGFFYAFLALLSCWGLWGFIKLAKFITNEQHRAYAILSYAIFFGMPFIATKADLNNIAMNFIPWIFYYFHKQQENYQAKNIFLGTLLLAIACLIRFQLGLVVIVVALYFLIELIRKKMQFSQFFAFLGSGLIGLSLIAASDLVTGRAAFSTIFEYLKYNFITNIASTQYGQSSIFTYIGILLTIFIPPLSLIFIYPLFKEIKKFSLITVVFLVFVIFHSLIANKLERFIFPMIPLFIFLSYKGFDTVVNPAWQKRLQNSAVLFIVLSFVFSFPIAFARGNMNIIGPAAYLSNSKLPAFLVKIDFWYHAYSNFRQDGLYFTASVEEAKFQAKQKNISNFHLLVMKKDQDQVSTNCRLENEFRPGFPENLAVKLNPKHNARRDATLLFLCQNSEK